MKRAYDINKWRQFAVQELKDAGVSEKLAKAYVNSIDSATKAKEMGLLTVAPGSAGRNVNVSKTFLQNISNLSDYGASADDAFLVIVQQDNPYSRVYSNAELGEMAEGDYSISSKWRDTGTDAQTVSSTSGGKAVSDGASASELADYHNTAEMGTMETLSQFDDETADNLAEQISSVSQANDQQAQDASAQARAARLQGADAGLGEGRAGLLGSLQQGSDNTNGYSSAISGQNVTTQADYLNKMQAYKNAQQDASNMRTGGVLNTVGSVLQGAGQGALMGAAFGSDENLKKAPSRKQLLDMVDEFRTLKKRLERIKGGK